MICAIWIHVYLLTYFTYYNLHDKSVVFYNIDWFRNRGRYCLLFCKGPILNDIRGHSDPNNICQIADSNYSKFSGGGPQTPRRRSRLRRVVRGFAPLPGPPFQNSWIRPWTLPMFHHYHHYHHHHDHHQVLISGEGRIASLRQTTCCRPCVHGYEHGSELTEGMERFRSHEFMMEKPYSI